MDCLFVGRFLREKDSYVTGPLKVVNELYRGFQSKGINVYNLQFSMEKGNKILQYISYTKDALALLRKNRECAVIISGVRGEGMVLLVLKKIGLIYNHLHYISHGCVKLEQKISNKKNTTEAIKEKIFLSYSDTVSTVSELLKNLQIVNHKIKRKNEKIKIIPNGIDKDFVEYQFVDVRNKFLNGCKKDIVFFPGGFKRIKNAEVLIKAYAANSHVLNELILVIAGDKGEDYETLNGYVKDDIYYVGKLDATEMKSFYKECSMMVLPSVIDTFGLVALEALLFHKPIIISKNVGLLDFIEDTQNFINVLEEVDEKHIIETILKTHNDMKNKLIDSVEIDKFVEKFYWSNVIDSYIRVLQD